MLLGVADGVGGLPGGAEAAQLAIEQVSEVVAANLRDTKLDLTHAVQIANRRVAELGHRISPSMGIGTTLTVGCIRQNRFTIAHVGDSRCYVGRGREFTRLTEDHSVENEARLRRARGEVVYYHEANRNALTRCVGQASPPEVDLIVRPIAAGERYLFCTDGVTRMLPDAELASLLARADDPDSALAEIVGLAVRRGGPDNATGVAVFVDGVET